MRRNDQVQNSIRRKPQFLFQIVTDNLKIVRNQIMKAYCIVHNPSISLISSVEYHLVSGLYDRSSRRLQPLVWTKKSLVHICPFRAETAILLRCAKSLFKSPRNNGVNAQNNSLFFFLLRKPNQPPIHFFLLRVNHHDLNIPNRELTISLRLSEKAKELHRNIQIVDV